MAGLSGWLRGIMEETFFVDCETHKSMKAMFCLYCCIGICFKCLPNHPSHQLIQVRRHRGSAVVKLADLRELIDCSLIQTYSTNAGGVIFLRPQPRDTISRITRKICSVCGINLNYNYPYCSLTCKVEHVRLQGNDISSILLQFDPSQFLLIEFENLQRNVYGQPNADGDHNQITPDLVPIDFMQGEGSSSGWSRSEIAESCKKNK